MLAKLELPKAKNGNTSHILTIKSIILLPTVTEREEGNKNALVSMRHEIDDGDKMLNEEENDKENKASKGTCCICNLNKVEDCLNQNLCCLCHVENFLVDLIIFCNDIDIKHENLAG